MWVDKKMYKYTLYTYHLKDILVISSWNNTINWFEFWWWGQDHWPHWGKEVHGLPRTGCRSRWRCPACLLAATPRQTLPAPSRWAKHRRKTKLARPSQTGRCRCWILTPRRTDTTFWCQRVLPSLYLAQPTSLLLFFSPSINFNPLFALREKQKLVKGRSRTSRSRYLPQNPGVRCKIWFVAVFPLLLGSFG